MFHIQMNTRITSITKEQWLEDTVNELSIAFYSPYKAQFINVRKIEDSRGLGWEGAFYFC